MLRVEDMEAQSAGQGLLQVFGGNEILILRMLANETGDVRAAWDNAKMIRAGEVERKARELSPQTLPFE